MPNTAGIIAAQVGALPVLPVWMQSGGAGNATIAAITYPTPGEYIVVCIAYFTGGTYCPRGYTMVSSGGVKFRKVTSSGGHYNGSQGGMGQEMWLSEQPLSGSQSINITYVGSCDAHRAQIFKMGTNKLITPAQGRGRTYTVPVNKGEGIIAAAYQSQSGAWTGMTFDAFAPYANNVSHYTAAADEAAHSISVPMLAGNFNGDWDNGMCSTFRAGDEQLIGKAALLSPPTTWTNQVTALGGKVLVTVGIATPVGVTSVTVGGVACGNYIGSNRGSIWVSNSPVPAGVQNIVMVFGGNPSEASFCAYDIGGMSVYHTAEKLSAPFTVNINVPANGKVFCIGTDQSTASNYQDYNTYPKWTGAGCVQQLSGSTYFSYEHGAHLIGNAETGRAITLAINNNACVIYSLNAVSVV